MLCCKTTVLENSHCISMPPYCMCSKQPSYVTTSSKELKGTVMMHYAWSILIFSKQGIKCSILLFFWTKSIVQYTKMKPQCFWGWLCPHLQVLGPLEGDNPNLSPSGGPNRVGFITWRQGQSQPLKHCGFILVYLMMGLVKKKKQYWMSHTIFKTL
jgi:hypothetical protein